MTLIAASTDYRHENSDHVSDIIEPHIDVHAGKVHEKFHLLRIAPRLSKTITGASLLIIGRLPLSGAIAATDVDAKRFSPRDPIYKGIKIVVGML